LLSQVVEPVVVEPRFGVMELQETLTLEHKQAVQPEATEETGLEMALAVEPVVEVIPVALVVPQLKITGTQVVRVVSQVSHSRLRLLQ
jgi:hypothetical protein